MFWKKTKKTFLPISRVLCVWNPAGGNSAKISWPLAREISAYTETALVELPCHGIPRLALEADLPDRIKHSDNAILEFERRNTSPFMFVQKPTNNLAVLPVNPYGLPDHPVIHKVSQLETLETFPHYFINQARKNGYNVIIFDCQGTLFSPMTFFSLRLADKIILCADSPAEIAWTLNNKERLIEAYHMPEELFIATSTNTPRHYFEEMEKVLKCPVLDQAGILSAISEPSKFSGEKQNYTGNNPEEQVI